VLRLLCDLYEPREGAIRVHGQPISKADLGSLRSRISLVAQDTHLFPVSIADNIAMARPEATQDEIVAAAKAANAHDFISALPKGYDSLGEFGNRLSGGGDSESVWHAPFSRTRGSCSSTSRRRRSTRKRKHACWKRSVA
jgi:ATP-binding cassette subfamily B protein